MHLYIMALYLEGVENHGSRGALLYPRFQRLDPNAEAGSASIPSSESAETGNDAGYSSKAPTSSQDSASFVQCFQWHGTDTS